MKEYPPPQLRNVGLFSHGGAGKTSLTEAMRDSGTVLEWDLGIPDEEEMSEEAPQQEDASS